MLQLNCGQYAKILKTCYDAKSPLFVYGPPGCGKSEICRQVFSKVAQDEGLEFREWTDITSDEKMECINHPEKYWILCDQRVGAMDPSDLRGIPNMANKEMLELIPYSWVIYFSKPEAHGAIFFDELNLAPPTVAGQAYQIINERRVADRKLSNHVFVFGAGNRAEDKANVFQLSFPLRDRFNEFEIMPDKNSWCEWAYQNKINPHIIAFINWKESYLYKPSAVTKEKGSTPRGLARASKLINNMDIISDDVHEIVSIACGESLATEFQAYCKHFQQLDWRKIYGDPTICSGFSVDKLWAIIGGISEHYIKQEKQFDEIIDVLLGIGHEGKYADFSVVGLRMIRDYDLKLFSKNYKASKSQKKIVSSFGKYILN